MYDKNNKLNELYLNTFLQQQQLKIEDIVQIIDFETRNEYFSNAFFKFNYPEYFDQKINSFENHQRKISYVVVDVDKILNNNILNKDSELKDYYDNNINNYMSKENRDIEYILIDKELIKNNFIASDYEINEYYNNNKDLFFQNEKEAFFNLILEKKKKLKILKLKLRI